MRHNGTAAPSAARAGAQPAPQQSYTVHHDFDGVATVTETVVHALSDVTGVDVTDTDFALYDYVDPDALNRLFAPKSDGTSRVNGHVSFTVMGYQTTIYASGQITIVPVGTAVHG